jgi:hypothetical protein
LKRDARFFTFELGGWLARKAAVHFSQASNSCKGDERFAVHHSHTPPKLAEFLLKVCLFAPLC